MSWPPWKKTEKRSFANFQTSEAYLSANGQRAAAASSGALEMARGCFEQAFRAARPDPELPCLDPATLAMIGRALVGSGEIVFVITLDSSGQPKLIPAGNFDVIGGPDPESWHYRITTNGPTGTRTSIEPTSNIVHLFYSRDPKRPWRGVAPLTWASSIGALAGNADLRLAQEASGSVSRVIPLPVDPGDGEDDQLSGLKDGIATARGEALFVETTASGWDEGKVSSPTSDWRQMRIGPAPDESFVALRKSAAEAVASACSIPVALLSKADGTALRESWRRFILLTIAPLGREIASELSLKLGVPGLRLRFNDLWAFDIAGRSRSLQLLVFAGVALQKALELSGLLIEDDA